MLEAVTELANSALPAEQSCDRAHFDQCLKAIDILPRRQVDAIGGDLQLKLYRKHLGGFSNDALSYLTSEATKTCMWFPTIAECLKILSAWPNRDRDAGRREKARVLCRNELQARMNDVLARLERRELEQEEIDGLPERVKLVAAEKGFLFALNDGRFFIRGDSRTMAEDECEAQRERVRQWSDEGLL